MGGSCDNAAATAAIRRLGQTAGMEFLEVPGLGQVSRVGLGTWQFGSREWGYGQEYASGTAREIVTREIGRASCRERV